MDFRVAADNFTAIDFLQTKSTFAVHAVTLTAAEQINIKDT